VIFAPYHGDDVGIFNPATLSFSIIAVTVTTSETNGCDRKFIGAATTGERVVFAPYFADKVGVFNTATNTLDQVANSMLIQGLWVTVSFFYAFAGAATSESGIVVFTPYSWSSVGMFNPLTNQYSCVNIEDIRTPCYSKYYGAVALANGLVASVPHSADNIGFFVTTQTFSRIDIRATISIGYKYLDTSTAEGL
jgi:hypothetical protein